MVLPQTLETLARSGANLDISAYEYLPQTLENLVRLAANNGSHITINASKSLPL